MGLRDFAIFAAALQCASHTKYTDGRKTMATNIQYSGRGFEIDTAEIYSAWTIAFAFIGALFLF